MVRSTMLILQSTWFTRIPWLCYCWREHYNISVLYAHEPFQFRDSKKKKKRFAGPVDSESAALESSQRDDCWGGAQLYQREMKIQRHCYKTNKSNKKLLSYLCMRPMTRNVTLHHKKWIIGNEIKEVNKISTLNPSEWIAPIEWWECITEKTSAKHLQYLECGLSHIWCI